VYREKFHNTVRIPSLYLAQTKQGKDGPDIRRPTMSKSCPTTA
jgi:hypothetical protein